MPAFGQLVIGPAGSGKSTFCQLVSEHCETVKRRVHVVNLDPAAEEFFYPCSVDIRDLVSLDDVMEELQLGPNGGLVYCIEYLVDHLDWLEDELSEVVGSTGSGDEYVLFDLPGQIELFSHRDLLKRLVSFLQQTFDYRICCVYIMDSQFVTDVNKFLSGCLVGLSSMVQLELPHVSILSKCDLVRPRGAIEDFLEAGPREIASTLSSIPSGSGFQKFASLNRALGDLLEDYGMVTFLPLDPTEEESVSDLLSQIDHAIQYGEDLEPKEPRDPDMEPGPDARGGNATD